jgi:hypothetical protein
MGMFSRGKKGIIKESALLGSAGGYISAKIDKK